MRLYLAGPMTGLPEWNYPAFFAAADLLDGAGFTVSNPAVDGQMDGWAWSDYMRRALRRLVDCQGVALLEGWVGSRGAMLEWQVARELGMPCRPVMEWLGKPAERVRPPRRG